MTVNAIYGLQFMPWTFELKMHNIFSCTFCYLGNHLGSVQKCIIWIPKVLDASQYFFYNLLLKLKLLENPVLPLIFLFKIIYFPCLQYPLNKNNIRKIPLYSVCWDDVSSVKCPKNFWRVIGMVFKTYLSSLGE